jgi:glycosyltransferase involved in cell wall biosynthesis
VKAGIATYLRELIEYQLKQNCEIFLCLSDYISDLEFPLEAKNIVRYPYVRIPKKIILAIYCIWKTINQIKPDIVHVHSSFAGASIRIGLFILPLKHPPKVVYSANG